MTERVRLKAGDPCQKCEHGILEQRSHRFSSERGPNLPMTAFVDNQKARVRATHEGAAHSTRDIDKTLDAARAAMRIVARR